MTIMAARDQPNRALESGRRRTWWALLAVLVVALLVGAVLIYLHWRSNARDLSSYDGIATTGSIRVGRTLYLDANVQPRHAPGREVLNLRSIKPRVETNTAKATITLIICRPRAGNGIGSTTSTRPFCTSARPFTPGPLNVGEQSAQIIYAITGDRPGIVRIAGCEVSYDDGSRSGNQRTGMGTLQHVRW